MSEARATLSEANLSDRKQALTFAYWAIRQVLDEAMLEAHYALIHAQNSGADISRPAGKIAAINEVQQRFRQYLPKEGT